VTGPGFDAADAADRLADVFGYRIGDGVLLTTALTHPSYASEHPDNPDYQRLEFLGGVRQQTRHLD